MKHFSDDFATQVHAGGVIPVHVLAHADAHGLHEPNPVPPVPAKKTSTGKGGVNPTLIPSDEGEFGSNWDWSRSGYDANFSAPGWDIENFLNPGISTPESTSPATQNEPPPPPDPNDAQVHVVQVPGTKELPAFGDLPAVQLPSDILDVVKLVVSNQVHSDCSNGTPGNKIDWNFIGLHEGNHTNMYVPTQQGTVIDDSGPSIAGGFDLGHKTVAILQALHLDASLITKLTPYLGHHGQEAVSYVAAHPLTISAPEVAQINSAVHAETLARAIVTYDNGVGKTGSFISLPGQVQTALADFAFNFNALDRFPVFWSQLTHEDWNGAIQNLLTWGGSAPGLAARRVDEAHLLQAALAAGLIAPGVVC